jgi:hypothetical protein
MRIKTATGCIMKPESDQQAAIEASRLAGWPGLSFFAAGPGVSKVNYDNRRMDHELKQYLEAMEERLNARIEKVETNLLTAFHGWARSMEIRVRGVSTHHHRLRRAPRAR